jgi:hypothetical protein
MPPAGGAQDLGPVIRTIGGEGLDPVGDALVDVSTNRARHLTICAIAHERMDEDELLGAGNGRTVLPSHELLSLECVQHLLEPPRVDVGETRDGVRPEHLPEDGSELQKLLLLAREGIDASDDDPCRVSEPPRQLRLRSQHPCVLLCEERVALGPRQERGLLIGGEYRSTEQPASKRAVSASDNGTSETAVALRFPPPSRGGDRGARVEPSR